MDFKFATILPQVINPENTDAKYAIDCITNDENLRKIYSFDESFQELVEKLAEAKKFQDTTDIMNKTLFGGTQLYFDFQQCWKMYCLDKMGQHAMLTMAKHVMKTDPLYMEYFNGRIFDIYIDEVIKYAYDDTSVIKVLTNQLYTAAYKHSEAVESANKNSTVEEHRQMLTDESKVAYTLVSYHLNDRKALEKKD